jgi:linoleoyl-CoA desaturase
VKALFEKYGLNYHEASMPAQVYSAWHKVVRLALPNNWMATTTPKNLPKQMKVLWKMSRGSRAQRRKLQEQLDLEAAYLA